MNVSLSWYSERVRVGVSLVAIVKGEGECVTCWDSEG